MSEFDLGFVPDKKLDSNFLSPKIGFILDECLIDLFDTTPPESLLLDLIVKIAQVAALKRARVEYYETNTLINVYALIFLESGEGKDKALDWIDDTIMGAYHTEFKLTYMDYLEKSHKNLRDEAEKKFQKSSSQRESYIESHRPRTLVSEMSDATLEGFMAMRESYSQVLFGGTFVKISEFGDYITSENNARKEFMSAITEVYNNGNSKAKVIKGERDYNSVSGVPNTILFHTSPSGLLSGRPHEKLLDFLNRGMGRRAFICMPSPLTKTNTNFDERMEQIKVVKENALEAKNIFNEFVAKEKYNCTYVFDTESNHRLFDYKTFNFERAIGIGDLAEPAVLAELKNRHWKVVKLAGLIASFEHPEVYEVFIDDLNTAIYISELYGLHFNIFFERHEITPTDKLYSYLKKNLNKWVPKMNIRKQTFVNQNAFGKWFKESIQDVTETAYFNGLRLYSQKVGVSIQYKLAEPEDELASRAEDFTDYISKKYGDGKLREATKQVD